MNKGKYTNKKISQHCEIFIIVGPKGFEPLTLWV